MKTEFTANENAFTNPAMDPKATGHDSTMEEAVEFQAKLAEIMHTDPVQARKDMEPPAFEEQVGIANARIRVLENQLDNELSHTDYHRRMAERLLKRWKNAMERNAADHRGWKVERWIWRIATAMLAVITVIAGVQHG